jgi:hypothetical protein
VVGDKPPQKSFVILSAVSVSRSEALTESKDHYSHSVCSG